MAIKKKYLLTGNMAGELRNGVKFYTTYNKDFGGHMMHYVDPERILNSDFVYALWNDRNLKHNLDKNLDIIKIFKIATISEYDMLRNGYWPDTLKEYWSEYVPPAAAVKPVNDISEVESSPIKVSTKVWIEINGKPVDLTNLSEEEKNVLKTFGII